MAELNALCLARGLQIGGEKAALVARLDDVPGYLIVSVIYMYNC
jgi:hypothetical protein